MKYTLSVLVENQPGVLSKVAGLFSRRGFNIDSLAVGVTEDPAISRMTIVVDGDEHIVEQVEKQLNKVIPVIKVKNLSTAGDFLSCELNLIKVSANAQQRTELLQLANLFDARVVDVSPTTMTLRFAGNPAKGDNLMTLLHPYGVKEVVRTGTIAIEKGSAVTRRKEN
ncbi:MAG TPA: acetolactate synthase small subunit [Firmicutes bacterium]|nr:acetolactate synthase small subunit [Bacillota bacterium]